MRRRVSPFALVIGAHQQEPRQLPGRAGGRLERRGGHAGDGAELLFQRRQQFQPTLGELGGRARVHGVESGVVRHGVTELGVVLHGARTERVHPEVDRELPMREPGEVGHQIALRDLGHVTTSPLRWAAGISFANAVAGTPVVRSWYAERPGTDISKIVGSVSCPISGADAARPPERARGGHWPIAFRSTST